MPNINGVKQQSYPALCHVCFIRDNPGIDDIATTTILNRTALIRYANGIRTGIYDENANNIIKGVDQASRTAFSIVFSKYILTKYIMTWDNISGYYKHHLNTCTNKVPPNDKQPLFQVICPACHDIILNTIHQERQDVQRHNTFKKITSTTTSQQQKIITCTSCGASGFKDDTNTLRGAP